jgi:hypothetical protein
MAQHHWYDATVDDEAFRALLGEYQDFTCIELPPDLPHVNDPTNLSVAALQAATVVASDNHKGKLQHFCDRMYQWPPTYSRTKQTGSSHAPTFESMVYHERDELLLGVGFGSSVKESEMMAAKEALEKMQKLQDEQSKPSPSESKLFKLSFRAEASELPFPLRFQLERSLLDPDFRIKKRPQDMQNVQERIAKIQTNARKRVLVFMQIVLPSLLRDISWKTKTKTFAELFAHEIWASLVKIKGAVEKGDRFDFWDGSVLAARDEAEKSLSRAEQVIGATEMQLDYGANDDFEIIQKRSLWPIAEYRCKIQVHSEKRKFKSASLTPIDFEIINRNVVKDTFVPPNTRRAIREDGWLFRDRFALISNLKFDRLYNSELEGFLASNPPLCGRQYSYLFDKGTGKPSVRFALCVVSVQFLLKKDSLPIITHFIYFYTADLVVFRASKGELNTIVAR